MLFIIHSFICNNSYYKGRPSDSLSGRERMGMWNIPNLQWV